MKKISRTVSTLALISTYPLAVAANTNVRSRPVPAGRPGSISSPFQPTGNELYDKFMKMVVQSPVSSMDSFLGQLKSQPDFFQSLKTKAVFYESQSRHESSAEFPRALIMYGNSDLILTFNGSPEQKIYGAMEIMGYNRNAGRFEYREITFKRDASPAQMASNNADGRDDFDFENQNVMVRKFDSSKCTTCHNDPSQPIWGTYLAWRGSFGSYEESFNLSKPRYAHSDNGLENVKLDEFKGKSQQMSRYRNFYWGQPNHPFEYEISSTLFGIALNYRMANSAMQEALTYLQKPGNDRYKYAFAGYLLNCDGQFLPDESNVSSIASELYGKRYAAEVEARKGIAADHRKYGDTIRWSATYPIEAFSRTNATTARPGSARQFAKLENLYRTMHLYSGKIYLASGGGSWDGYNQAQDFMTDYFDKYYGLPSTTLLNQKSAEKRGGFAAGVERDDLHMPLQDQEFLQIKPMIDALGLPAMPQGGVPQLCQQLLSESQRQLAR